METLNLFPQLLHITELAVEGASRKKTTGILLLRIERDFDLQNKTGTTSLRRKKP